MATASRPAAGNPAAGLLVLLVGLYLLLAYFAGRLEWLFSLQKAAGAARASSTTADASSAAASDTSSGSPGDDSIERPTSSGTPAPGAGGAAPQPGQTGWA